MISQLKSNSVILLQGRRTRVTQIQANASAYRQVTLCLYGKDKTLKITKVIDTIKGIGKVALCDGAREEERRERIGGTIFI
jgi:hypothetical protein